MTHNSILVFTLRDTLPRLTCNDVLDAAATYMMSSHTKLQMPITVASHNNFCAPVSRNQGGLALQFVLFDALCLSLCLSNSN